MKKAIKSIYFSFFIFFTMILLTDVNAHLIDLKEYEKKPAAILRELLKIVNENSMQICHLKESLCCFNSSFVVFGSAINVLLPDQSENQYIVNCMILEGYFSDGTLLEAKTIQLVEKYLEDIEVSLIMPIEIHWTHETIRIIVAPKFGGREFSYQIILNIDLDERQRIQHSTLTSTLHSISTNKFYPKFFQPYSDDDELKKEYERQEVDNDFLYGPQLYFTPVKKNSLKSSPKFDLSQLDLKASSECSSSDNDADADEVDHEFNAIFDATFKDYLEHVEETRVARNTNLPFLESSEHNDMQQNLPNRIKKNKIDIMPVASLRDSQVMYFSDLDYDDTIHYNTPVDVDKRGWVESEEDNEVYRDW